jgi:hypothetical protein
LFRFHKARNLRLGEFKMPHPLVSQLRFTRGELVRCLAGVDEADARRRVAPMNCLSWIVGHLANQENRYWVTLGQGQTLHPELNEQVGYRKPASTPPFEEMWETWRAIAHQADGYLDTLTPELMQKHFEWKGKTLEEDIGTMLLRNIHHYWYHIGEAAAIRQMLGHTDLPEFVGDMSSAGYHPEH